MENAASPQENTPPSLPKPRFNNYKIVKYLPRLIGASVIVLTLTLGITIYSKYKVTQQELQEYKEDPNVLAFKEKYNLIARVAKHVYIPTEETPTIATVTNAFKLKEQTFFSNTENGDKVIIYPESGRAILYRPSIDKVVEAAPVNITDLENTVSTNNGINSTKDENDSAEETTPSAVLGDKTTTNIADDKEKTSENKLNVYKIVVLNGTNYEVEGLAGKASNLIGKDFATDRYNVISTGNANKFYEKSLLINLTSEETQEIKALANAFDANIDSAIPDKEKVIPGANIILFVGMDFSKR